MVVDEVCHIDQFIVFCVNVGMFLDDSAGNDADVAFFG